MKSRWIIFLLLALCTIVSFAQQDATPAPPHAIVLGNTALAPVRAIAEGIGATVTASSDANLAVTLTRDDHVMRLSAYSTEATLDGKQVSLPVLPLIRDNQLFVPVRVIATEFGATVGVIAPTTSDSASMITVTYQGQTTRFRTVEEARILQADLTGDGQLETAFAVANRYGIDAYNSRYPSDIVDLETWVVSGTRERWRKSLAQGVSINRFQAQDITGDRVPELLLYYFTRHSYMGPYPGSVYRVNIFRWNGESFPTILAQDYSRDHGHFYLYRPHPHTAVIPILVDTNWQRNEDNDHYVAEQYTWDGRSFRLEKRVVTRNRIASLRSARRLLGLGN